MYFCKSIAKVRTVPLVLCERFQRCLLSFITLCEKYYKGTDDATAPSNAKHTNTGAVAMHWRARAPGARLTVDGHALTVRLSVGEEGLRISVD